MDYYYTAADDASALTASEQPGGPMPDSGFVSAGAKDVMACPHLEQLVAITTGRAGDSLIPQLKTLLPEANSPEPGTMIIRLPDALRDDLAAIEMTPAIAEAWTVELWGFEPDLAAVIGSNIILVARSARDNGQPLYWWSEM